MSSVSSLDFTRSPLLTSSFWKYIRSIFCCAEIFIHYEHIILPGGKLVGIIYHGSIPHHAKKMSLGSITNIFVNRSPSVCYGVTGPVVYYQCIIFRFIFTCCLVDQISVSVFFCFPIILLYIRREWQSTNVKVNMQPS